MLGVCGESLCIPKIPMLCVFVGPFLPGWVVFLCKIYLEVSLEIGGYYE